MIHRVKLFPSRGAELKADIRVGKRVGTRLLPSDLGPSCFASRSRKTEFADAARICDVRETCMLQPDLMRQSRLAMGRALRVPSPKCCEGAGVAGG